MPSLHPALLIAVVILVGTIGADDVVNETAATVSCPGRCSTVARSIWDLQITDEGVFVPYNQLVIIIAVSAASFSFLTTFFCLICCGYSCNFLVHCFSTCGRQPEVKNKPKGTNKIGQASKLAVSMTSFQKNEFFEDCCP